MNAVLYRVFVSRTTTCWVSRALTLCVVGSVWGVCPQAQQPSSTAADPSSEITAAQRREAIARAWRDAKPTPVPLVGTEPAWTVTLPAAPSAPGALDDRRVISLRSNLCRARSRDGRASPEPRDRNDVPAPRGRPLAYVVAGGRIHA